MEHQQYTYTKAVYVRSLKQKLICVSMTDVDHIFVHNKILINNV